MKTVTIVKIGGNVIDNSAALSAFVADFAKLEGPKILVHGGGKEATRLSATLGIETKMIDGRRVTDRETLDVVTMVYAGLINKRIVAMLQAAGCDAIGMCGADGNVIPATRRKPMPVDYGYVGDIDASKINHDLIARLLEAGICPVFCAITHDGAGSLLNSNADSVASSVAIAVSAIAESRLVFCFEKAGVLADVNNPDSVIPLITPGNYASLRGSGAISSGMIPKIDNALLATKSGVKSVIIKHSGDLLADSGTTITT